MTTLPRSAARLTLVAPPLEWDRTLRLSFQPPLNLLYLHSFLQARGVAVELLDVVSHAYSLPETITRVLASQADLVGIPLYYASLENAFALVKELRRRAPHLRFVAGGPCMTMEPERMMREGNLDFGVIGEGEETLAALLSTDLSSCPDGADSPLSTIDGLAWRHGDAIRINPRRAPIANLDALPFLDFSTLNNEYYFAYQEKMGVPRTLFLNSSRGCTFRCTYCCTPVLWPGSIRRYSPRRLIDEIVFQRTRFPGVEIGFCDDSFFSDKSWLREFMGLVSPLGLKYQCIGRADHLATEDIGRLVDSGLNYIAFGVETGSSSRQKTLKKHLDLTKLVQVMRELTKYKIKT